MADNPPGEAPLIGWQHQPQLALLHRLDIIEQLPLPVPDEATGRGAQPADEALQILQALQDPDVLQGVQRALASTRSSMQQM